MKTLSKNEWIAVVVSVVIIGFFFIFGSTIINAFKGTSPINTTINTNLMDETTNTQMDAQANATGEAQANPGAASTGASIAASAQTTSSGLGIKDVVTGTGDLAKPGQTVTVNYVGTFTNGQVFDSSLSRGVPFSFLLGAGQVIKGWDEGVAGMRVGGTRILTIPSSLGYGPMQQGPIPGGSTLIFQVELLKVTK